MNTEERRLGSIVWSAVRVAGWILALVLSIQAQTPYADNPQYPGDSATWGPASSTTATNAHDYVDASVFSGDFCAQLNAALNSVVNSGQYHSKAVIDARGIYPPVGGHLSCATSPWNGFTESTAPFSTVLLPAGLIQVSTTWTLPQTTKLVGEGPNVTILQAASNFPNDPIIPIIDMGSSTICPGNTDCNSVAVEHLQIDGGNTAITGIRNEFSQELSYVNDVWIKGVAASGTGLMIVGQYDTAGGKSLGYAVNSGPYSNIYFTGGGTCVNVVGTYGTRGIHGLTCIGSGTGTGSTGVLLDGNNNSVEDVYVSGYTNGVTLGSQPLLAQNSTLSGYAQDNILLNIAGGAGVTNVIHICGPAGHSTAPCSSTSYVNVPGDITVLGVSRTSGSTTILDEVTKTTLTDSTLALYVLGEPVVSGGSTYPVQTSRFTTANTLPAWFVGASAPTTGSSCTGETGSLFSATGAGSGTTLSVCAGGKWSLLQQ